MSDSGANTAAAVTRMVSARGIRASNAVAPEAPTTDAGGFATVAMRASSNPGRTTYFVPVSAAFQLLKNSSRFF